MEMKIEIYHQHNIEMVRFQRACEQILQLNGKLEEISKRYMSAKDSNNKLFRYSLRNRMLIIEGMLTAYCGYAKMKKSEILELRRKLNVEINSVNEEFSSDDEEMISSDEE
jgi:transposase